MTQVHPEINIGLQYMKYIEEYIPKLHIHQQGLDRKKDTAVRRSLTILGSTFGSDSISEEVAGFSPFMVSPRKKTVFIVSYV